MNIITLNRVLLNNTPLNYRRKRILTEKDFYFKTIERIFTFSKSAGGKSIKDGRAYIKRIKGNSIVWNQLALPFNELTNTPFYSFSIANGVLTITVLREHTANSAAIRMKNSTISGHSYLFTIDGSNSQNIDMQYRCGSAFNRFSAPIANAVSEADLYIYPFGALSTTIPAGATATIKSWGIHDLTQMFQAGNEPTTIEEFNARVATLGVDLNAYNEGQVIHCNTESIKSVGDNQWKEEELVIGRLADATGQPLASKEEMMYSPSYTKILPNTQYFPYVGTYNGSRVAIYIYFYDVNYNYISNASGTDNKVFTTPSNAWYIRFFVYNTGGVFSYNFNDICISLYHSGWKAQKDDQYQPYWQDILPLPIIRKYFPQGMKKAGSAHDEIRFNKASGKWEYSKGRMKEVDLGTLNWSKGNSGAGGAFYASLNNASNTTTRNVITIGKYEPHASAYTNSDPTRDAICISVKRVYVTDTQISDVATFKAAMQGVMLYYESNDWEWVELDAEDQNFRDYYNVADFGTEMSQSSVPSAALLADVGYYFKKSEVKELTLN